MSFFLALVSGCISNTSTEAVNNYHYEVDTVIYLDHMEDNLFLQSNIIAHIYEAEANIDLFEFIFDVDNIVGVVIRIDYPIEGYVDYKEFYNKLYPIKEEPLFHIHLNVDYPFNLTGILYFPKIKNNIEVQKNKIQLYSNQVFVTDSVEGSVPEDGCVVV